MKKTTIFYDFDGTLMNTNDLVIESFQEIYRYYRGREESVEKILTYFGEPLVDTLKREFGDIDLDEVITRFRSHQKEIAQDYLKVFPGVNDMLKAFEQKGYKQAIVTSRTHEGTVRYIKMAGLYDCFDLIVGCDDTENSKPSPDPIYFALDKFGAKKEEAIMIGDGAFDIKCADSAGIESVLVGWRITGANDLIGTVHSNYEVETPQGFVELMEKLNTEK